MSKKGKIKKRSKKPKTFNKDSLIKGALRRVFARSPQVREILNKNKKIEPLYNKDGTLSKRYAVYHLCNICQKWVRGKMSVDHIDPVVSIDGKQYDWNTFIEKLFCGPENLQCTCKKCHAAKTAMERKIREANKK